MKKLLLLLLSLISLIASAQKIVKTQRASRFSIHVIGDDFEGVIFSGGYNLCPVDSQKYRRFTPTVKEVVLAEKLLDQDLDTLKGGDEGRTSSYIHQNIRGYNRQYWGFFNEKNEKIIFISALDKTTKEGKNKESWLKGCVTLYDGGVELWRVKVNLENEALYGLVVNPMF